MGKAETVFLNPQFSDQSANKVNNFTGEDLTADTYYFKSGQVLPYHRHPHGDQVFFILKGEGNFYLDNGGEEVVEVNEGSIIYVPAGVWHKLENTGTELIASQVTAAGAGHEPRS
ncbi:MAG: cupin domain-containing protein [Firmicutes bacterium]|nr:cupin domain-containing protein [Bacillota bacterium]